MCSERTINYLTTSILERCSPQKITLVTEWLCLTLGPGMLDLAHERSSRCQLAFREHFELPENFLIGQNTCS